MNAALGALDGWRYDPKAMTPRLDVPYGDIANRKIRYAVARAYKYNTMFDKLDNLAGRLKEDERLYKFIRAIYNPVKLENDLYINYTYKGTIDTQTFKGGSLPLRYDNSRLLKPLQQIVKWSNLDQQLGTYVGDAALLGDAAWWVCDEPETRRVRLECLDPSQIKYVKRDSVGNIKACVLEYMRYEEPELDSYVPSKNGDNVKAPKQFRYNMVADGYKFRTYKDGEKYYGQNDENGNPVWEWDNPFGFVPLKLAYFAEGQDGWGANSFFGLPRRLIDETADQMSLTNDSIRNVIMPLLAAIGITPQMGADGKPLPINIDRDERTGVTIVNIPNEKGDLKPITIPLDLDAAMNSYRGMMADVEKNMPILSLSHLHEIPGSVSGIALSNMMSMAISTIQNLQKNLDPGLIGALQMALTIGGVQGYDGFSGITLDSFQRGDLDMNIVHGSIIDDGMDKAQKVTNIISLAPLPAGSKRAGYMEMGFSETDIDDIIEADKQEADEAARMAARGFGQGIGLIDDTSNGGTSKPPKIGQGTKQLALPETVSEN